MNMKKELTIIVPSYNVENYLRECIPPYVDPICDERLELIIVNDGSTDSTKRIAEEFVEMYPSVIRLINKENGGHGSTINCGLNSASGRYFKVIDGDDYVENNELINFLDFIQESNEDVLTNDKINFIDGTKKREKHCFGPVQYNTPLSINEINREWNYSMHRITVKTSLLKENMPPIDEHCFYVDQEFIFYSLPFVKTLRASDAIMYNYRLGNANQSVSEKNMFKRRENLYRVINSILDFYPQILKAVDNHNVLDYINFNLGKQYKQYAWIVLTNSNSTLVDTKAVLELYFQIRRTNNGVFAEIKDNKLTKLLRLVGPEIYTRLLLPIVSKKIKAK